MNVVLLCREGPVARRLARMLSEHGLLDAVVAEEGSDARARKMRREWAQTPWWRVPLFGLDLIALAIYGTLWSREMKKRLAAEGAGDEYPVGVPIHPVGDANDARCVALLRDLAPDVLVVFGTAILKRPVLDTASELALNVHGGVVPKYRNVHSEVWAVLNGDTGSVGSSILHLDEGIDSGAIALQERVDGATGFFDLRWRNVELSQRLIIESLQLHAKGELPKTPQDSEDAGFYRTPGVGPLLRLAFRKVGG